MLVISINKVFCFELRYETRAFESNSQNSARTFFPILIIRIRWKLRSIKIRKKKEKETRLKNYYF